jgi:hypothetical protein
VRVPHRGEKGANYPQLQRCDPVATVPKSGVRAASRQDRVGIKDNIQHNFARTGLDDDVPLRVDDHRFADSRRPRVIRSDNPRDVLDGTSPQERLPVFRLSRTRNPIRGNRQNCCSRIHQAARDLGKSEVVTGLNADRPSVDINDQRGFGGVPRGDDRRFERPERVIQVDLVVSSDHAVGIDRDNRVRDAIAVRYK